MSPLSTLFSRGPSAADKRRATLVLDKTAIERGAEDKYKVNWNPLKKNQDATNRRTIMSGLFRERMAEEREMIKEVRKKYSARDMPDELKRQLDKQRHDIRRSKRVDQHGPESSVRQRKEREVEREVDAYRRKRERLELSSRKRDLKKQYARRYEESKRNLLEQYKDVRQGI